MRQPDSPTAHDPAQATDAAALVSAPALGRIYAAITAAVAIGLLVDALAHATQGHLHLWPLALSAACVAWGGWLAVNHAQARLAWRLGFVAALCLAQIAWSLSLPPGELPASLILLPLLACLWAAISRRSRPFPVHVAVMLAALLAVGVISGVLPGGSAFGGAGTREWMLLSVALGLSVFCGTVVNRALRSQLQQLQRTSDDMRAALGERDEGRQFLQAVIDTGPYGIAAIDLPSGRTVFVNTAFEDLLGFSRAELTGRNLGEQLQLDGGGRAVVRQTRAAGGRLLNLNLTVRNRAGAPRLTRGGGSIFSLGGAEYYLWVTRDVTDERLVQMERDAIFATSPIGIFTERDGLIRVISAELERWLGWPSGSGVLRPVASLVGGDNALREWRSRCDASLNAGDLACVEWPMFRADSSPFTARFTGRRVDPGEPGSGNAPLSTVWIVQDVSEEIERQRLLEIARLRAEDGARSKSRFLVNMSHQLRTPMNALLSLAELARDIDSDPAQQRHLVGHIAGSARSLAALLSDVLDLSSLEERSMLLVIEDFHLGHLIDRIDATFQPLVRQRGLFLRMQLGPGCDTWISTDARRVRQIITNFVNHALNHCNRGSIGLRVMRTDAGRLRVETHAEGLVLNPAEAERLFTPFDAFPRLAERESGTALGLAICRDLARLMEGEVGVAKDPLTGGATLWLELPLTLARRVPGQNLASIGAAVSLAGVRVLLVEDDELSTVSLTLMLQRWGMHVESVSDGMQAVRRALSARDSGRPFDLVLMDLHLPFMHGTEATSWLRREGLDAAQLPIVALTAGSMESEREQALQAGANDFLSKPVDADALRRHIAKLLPRATTAA